MPKELVQQKYRLVGELNGYRVEVDLPTKNSWVYKVTLRLMAGDIELCRYDPPTRRNEKDAWSTIVDRADRYSVCGPDLGRIMFSMALPILLRHEENRQRACAERN